MMKILNGKTDREEWITLWNRWQGREVFAHPDYIDLYVDKNSQSFCAVSKQENSTIIYPFIKRSLVSESYCNEDIYDLTTVYGYGDIYVLGVLDALSVEQFCVDFHSWACNNNVVCEFIRFALDSVTKDYYCGDVVVNNQNIFVDLSLSHEQMWSNFKHKVRKNVNRAKSYDIEIVFDSTGERLNDFLKIYYGTMERRQAGAGYYFPKEYFESIISKLQGQFVFCHALWQGVVISTELVLVSDDNIYSFLGGTTDKYFEMRPNDLLKFEIINWGREHNKKRFILGGGYVPMDGIFQYKQAFAPHGDIPFYIGQQIFNPAKYNKLIDDRRKAEPQWSPNEAFFPLYRA